MRVSGRYRDHERISGSMGGWENIVRPTQFSSSFLHSRKILRTLRNPQTFLVVQNMVVKHLFLFEFFDPTLGHLMARHLLLNFEKVIVYTVCHGKVVIIGDQTSVGIINLSQFRINIWTKHKL